MTTPPPSISQIVGESPSHSGAPGLGLTKPHVPERRTPNTISPRPSADSAVPTRSSRTPALAAALGHAAGEHEDHEHDQDLAREDVAPREVGREQAADDRPDRDRDRGRGGDEPVGAGPFVALEVRGDERDDRGQDQRRADALQARPADQQHGEARRDRRDERAAAVDDAADREGALATDDLADLAAGDHQRGHHERVERDRRLDSGRRSCPTSLATVAIDTFMTELSSIIRNWPAHSVTRTVLAALEAVELEAAIAPTYNTRRRRMLSRWLGAASSPRRSTAARGGSARCR